MNSIQKKLGLSEAKAISHTLGPCSSSDQSVLYSLGDNDECYTPPIGVRPILKYLPKDKTIWCPFDTEESWYVRLLRSNRVNVVYSHISYGQDFYYYEPENWDILVSNPPYTNKREIFEREAREQRDEADEHRCRDDAANPKNSLMHGAPPF